MVDEITITLDGVQFKTQPGKMLLEAAIEAGVYIPYLCYHPGMKPFAACRLCVVEVEGGRGYPASCTLPVQDGMVVNNNSHQVYELRRSVMEMLISEHPNGCLTCHRVDLCGPEDVCLRHVSVNDRCVTCPKNERCELKDTTRFLDVDLESPLTYKYRNLPIDTGDPFYDRDYNLCIVCGRCVRVCEEVRGDNAITFTERAGLALVGTSHGTSLLESGCEFCGACLDVCPVGALVERDHKWEKASRVERTICPHCPVGCQLNLEINKYEKVVRTIPELSGPSNRGQACFKGKFGLDYVNNKKRLKVPLIRSSTSEPFKEATWEEALDLIAEKLPSHKGTEFAFLTAPDGTNEEHYLAQKFARTVMVTNNVDQTSDTQIDLVKGLQEALGYSAATNPIWDLEDCGCILVFCSNITEDHNVAAVPIKKAVKAGAKLIVIDPRQVELTRYASSWLRPRPGTEMLLLGALLKAIVDGGQENTDWLQEHCQGYDTLIQALGDLDMDDIVRQTGVSAELIEGAATTLAGSSTAAVLYALDNIPREIRRGCVSALVDLAAITGNLGKGSTGLYPLRQGTNEQGAWDVGCVPHLLPGYRSMEDSGARHAFEDSWGIMVPIESGLSMGGMLEAVEGKDITCMMIVGEIPGVELGRMLDWSEPGLVGETTLETLEKLDFLVVQDHFLGPLAQRAHVVLPRSTFAEKEGTYTNLERRVQLVHPAIEIAGNQAKPEWWTICQVAQRMGAAGFDFESPSQVMDEIAALVPQYGGISHRRLEGEVRLVARPDSSNPLPTQVLYSDREDPGIQWPCPSESHAGTPILYTEGFPNGKMNMPVPDFKVVAATDAEDGRFLYLPGRVLVQSEREIQIVNGKQNQVKRDELVELNPVDAEKLDIHEGDPVRVQTSLELLQGKATLKEDVPVGTVSCTTLFGQLAVELQGSDQPNPMARVPGLVVAPATVVKDHP